MSKSGQQQPYVTGDIEALTREEIKECHFLMSQDPAYKEWADSYDEEANNARSGGE